MAPFTNSEIRFAENADDLTGLSLHSISSNVYASEMKKQLYSTASHKNLFGPSSE